MKKLLPHFVLCLVLSFGFQTTQAQDDLILTAVFDGNLTGQLPKGIELYAVNDIPDMSVYGIGSANNGGGSDGIEFTFPEDSYPAGSYIYVATETPEFTTFFGFSPDYTTNAVNINGDDAIELFLGEFEEDVYGEIEYSDMDVSWSYLNGWAYRNDGTGPDGTTFVMDNWTISGEDALSGAATNAEADIPIPVGTYSPEENDDPVLSFETTALSVVESDGIFDVSVTIVNPNVNATSVEVVLTGGTAVNGVDFEFDSPELVVFPAGSVESQTVSIDLIDNTEVDGDRTIELSLQNPDNNAIIGMGEMVITITDDDEDPVSIYDIVSLRVNDADGVPDLIDEYGEVHGIVHGVNTHPEGLQFTLIDPTDGIAVFLNSGNLDYEVQEGDSIHLRGTVDFFNGLTQIVPDSIQLIASGLTPYAPEVVVELNESTESNVVQLNCVWVVDTTEWTGMGSGFTVEVTDGTNSYDVRIAEATDLYSQPAPEGVLNISGIGGQYDEETPYDEGYELLPRYSEDIAEGGEECMTSVSSVAGSSMLIYPNPVVDRLNFAGDKKIYEIRIADLTGKTLRHVSANGSKTMDVNVGDLPSGLYLIEVYTESGRLVREIVKP